MWAKRGTCHVKAFAKLAAAAAAPPRMRQQSLAKPAVESLATSETEREEGLRKGKRQK